MTTRLISGIVAIPLLIVIILAGNDVLKTVAIIISLIGINELYKAFSKGFKSVHICGYLATVLYILFIEYFIEQTTIFLTLFLLTSFVFMVIEHKKVNMIDFIITIFGFFYIPFMLVNIYIVRQIPQTGMFFVWLIFISAWGCDTGAYFVGIAFGKRKLIPELSPKKTVEGAIGGIVVATLLGLAYGFFVASRLAENIKVETISICVLTCFFGSILSQFGDLTASSIKRYTKIKDFGKIMPGHGGVLDRFDSVIFTSPTIYITIIFLKAFFVK